MAVDLLLQVPIFQCLAKFDGSTISDDIRAGRRKFRVTRLPNFLALQFKRFTKNNFFIEKNPTLVTFPVKNLELKEALPVPMGESSFSDKSPASLASISLIGVLYVNLAGWWAARGMKRVSPAFGSRFTTNKSLLAKTPHWSHSQ